MATIATMACGTSSVQRNDGDALVCATAVADFQESPRLLCRGGKGRSPFMALACGDAVLHEDVRPLASGADDGLDRVEGHVPQVLLESSGRLDSMRPRGT